MSTVARSMACTDSRSRRHGVPGERVQPSCGRWRRPATTRPSARTRGRRRAPASRAGRGIAQPPQPEAPSAAAAVSAQTPGRPKKRPRPRSNSSPRSKLSPAAAPPAPHVPLACRSPWCGTPAAARGPAQRRSSAAPSPCSREVGSRGETPAVSTTSTPACTMPPLPQRPREDAAQHPRGEVALAALDLRVGAAVREPQRLQVHARLRAARASPAPPCTSTSGTCCRSITLAFSGRSSHPSRNTRKPPAAGGERRRSPPARPTPPPRVITSPGMRSSRSSSVSP